MAGIRHLLLPLLLLLLRLPQRTAAAVSDCRLMIHLYLDIYLTFTGIKSHLSSIQNFTCTLLQITHLFVIKSHL